MVGFGFTLIVTGATVVAIAVGLGKLTGAGRKLRDPRYHAEQERLKRNEYWWDYHNRLMMKEADVMIPMFVGLTGAACIVVGIVVVVIGLLKKGSYAWISSFKIRDGLPGDCVHRLQIPYLLRPKWVPACLSEHNGYCGNTGYRKGRNK